MGDWWFYIAAFGIGIILVIFNMYQAEKSRKKRFLIKLREEWGKFSEREYSYEEYECISHYYKSKEYENYIDDITWNDLDMDSIFKAMNNTQSSLGAEVLYEMLRVPAMEKEVLKERERLICFITEHPEQRTRLQVIFATIGRTKAYSVTDYISMLDQVRLSSNGKHIVIALIALSSIVSLFINPIWGLVFVLCAFILSAGTYYKEKGQVEPYLTSFAYVLRMLKASELIQKENIAELKDYCEELKVLNKRFTAFRKNAGLVMGMKSSGNLMDMLLDYVRMFFHVDLMKFNQMIGILRKEKENCSRMIGLLGSLEAAIAAASFRQALPTYSLPEFADTKECFIKAEELYHPMIPNAVRNGIAIKRGALITGSNASGKSTFLKTVAINTILSQSIHTSIAKSYQAPFFRVYSSMSLRDNLAGNESYYMVEIKALRRILQASKEDTPMLSFVDEVLRGTNTVERIAASSHILKELNQRNVISFAATHDIELTYLLEDEYENFHFTEEIKEGDILFNYRLFQGRAQSRNAIKLLELMGYDRQIVDSALACANNFLETGQWKM